MKTIINIIGLSFFLIYSVSLFAQDTTKVQTKEPSQQGNIQHGRGFVDKNNDGFNDNAPDDDGDGIPNGLDPDYVRNRNKQKYVDLDGDGINDYLQNRKGKRGRMRKSNDTVEPQSSTTQESGSTGTTSGQQKRKGRTNR